MSRDLERDIFKVVFNLTMLIYFNFAWCLVLFIQVVIMYSDKLVSKMAYNKVRR